MVNASERLARVRDGLTPREWAGAGAMAAAVLGLNVAGWVLLAAAVGGHYHITSTELFGFGTGILAYTAWNSYSYGEPQSSAVASIGFGT